MSKLFNLIIEILSLPFKIIGIPLKIIDTILKLVGLFVLGATVYFLNVIPTYTDFVNQNLPVLSEFYINSKKFLGMINQDEINKIKDSLLKK
jgi:uncharacterized membrane protein